MGNELRSLKRVELLEIIAEQRKQIEELNRKLAEAEERLEAGCFTIDLRGVSSVSEARRIIRVALTEDEQPETDSDPGQEETVQ